MNYTTQEQALLQKLNIKDFRHLKTKHALELASSLKDLTPEIQAKIIEQIPGFESFLENTLTLCKDQLDSILKSNEQELVEVFSSYNAIMNELQEILHNDPNLSFDQKMLIMDKIGDYANKKAELHIQEQKFKEKVLYVLGGACAAAVSITGALLGGKLLSGHDDSNDSNV